MMVRIGLLLLLLGLAGPVAADPIRAPLWGEPAMQMDPPSGWKISRGGWLSGDHFVIALKPDRAGLLALSMMSRDTVPPLRDIAQKIAGNEWVLDAGSSAGSIDGRDAEVFTATETSDPKHTDRKARYVIARIDDHHIAVVVAIMGATETDADRKATDDAVASVRMVRPKSAAGS
jgi:hypothetical protein